MLWIGEVEDAKSIDELITLASLPGPYSLISRSRADSRKSQQGPSRNKSPQQKVWTIYDFFKISSDCEAILDFRDFSKVQLKNDEVQVFHTKWDEVLSSESLNKMQVGGKSEEL